MALSIDTSLSGITNTEQPDTAPTQPVPQPATKPASVQQDLSWLDRAVANFQDAWRTGTVAGSVATMAQTELGGDTAAVESERKRRAEFESMPSWLDAPDAMGRLKGFSAMIAGQIAGNLASPESLLAPPAKAGMWALQAGSKLAGLGRRAVVQGGTSAATNLATDPLIQGANIASGVQDEYNVAQTALAPVLGAATGGALGAAGMMSYRGDAAKLEQAINTRELVTGKKLEGWEKEALKVANDYMKPDELDKYAGNINLDRIRAGEDVYKLIAETAETHKATIDAIRRGSISNEELRGMAKDLDMTPEKFLAMVKPGSILNAENMLAARQLMVDASVDTVGAAKAYSTNPTNDTMAYFLESLDMSEKLIKAISGPTAESGRLQQQFNIIVPGEDRVKALQYVLSKNPELAKDAPAMAAMVSSLENPSSVRDFLRRAGPPTTGLAKWVEAWKAGLLTSVRTHEINILSNAIVNAFTMPTEMLAATVGKARTLGGKAIAAAQGKEYTGEEARTMAGAMSRLGATFMSPNEQLSAWGRFMEASKTAETPAIFRTRAETEAQNAIGGTVGETIRAPFRFLTAQDAFFKTIAARQELTASAWDALKKQDWFDNSNVQQRVDFIRTFVSNPPKEALDKAVAQANYMTFNKELGNAGQALQSLVKSQPALEFIVPFVRTPVNIIKYGMEHTPLVLFNPSYRNLKGQELDLAIAKATMGSSVMAGAFLAAKEGTITGAGPQDTGELVRLKATGWEPYSIRVGNKYYPYERIQPLGMLLGIAADMQYLQDDVDEAGNVRGVMTPQGEIKKADLNAAYATHIFMENIVNSTFTTQINNLFEALNDDTGTKMQNFINAAAGSLVPNIVGDVAKAMDPTIRVAQGPIESIQARIPGLSQNLPAARDWTGAPRVREHGPVAQMISPIHPTTLKDDPAVREVARINYAMPPVPKKIGNRELTPEQRELYAETAGQFRYNNITKVVTSPGYKAYSSSRGGDELVRQSFAKAVANADMLAKETVMKKYPKLREAEIEATTRPLGMIPRQELRAIGK